PSNQSKTGQKNITPLNGKKGCDKKQQTKTTKHTIEFSNNTPARPRNYSAANGRVFVVRTLRKPTEVGFPSGTPPRSSGLARVAATPISYVRDNVESNGLLGRVFRTSTPVVRTVVR
ncbi:hypothetical protein ABGB19_25785, partial [Mycobacterium sp. B14F4]|uniref:hypothetical protein n=1 Tax=Mycobacterium sp. B14F4 TaxID=3153565 RepID=UPI00325C4609